MFQKEPRFPAAFSLIKEPVVFSLKGPLGGFLLKPSPTDPSGGFPVPGACGFGDQWRRCVEVLRFLQRKAGISSFAPRVPLNLGVGLQKGTRNGLPWQMETRTKPVVQFPFPVVYF